MNPYIVRAKYQLSYEGRPVLGNEEFEMDQKDYEKYKNDVVKLSEKDEVGGFKERKYPNKQLKSKRTK